MQTEIEIKFLDIDPTLIRQKLREIGGKLIYPERFMKRKNFDYPDKRLEKIGGWVRLRDEGDKATLSYKQLDDRTLHGTKEIPLEVDNFGKTENFLAAIGLSAFAYQETKREKWTLGHTDITIDTWPWIPMFIEIEGLDEKTLREVVDKLGLDWSKGIHGSVEIAYQNYFDVRDEDIYGADSITFGPVPEWLEAKRRK